MEDMHEAELRAHYELGEERDRLAAGHGVLEFVRTTEIVLRYLPPAPARVADVGGGPGRYALWLAELGYEVEHRDLIST
jgi:2-polyprenyl-3-methyl-5-hydroxy-6-metoxy-1,4-benzoquinol methylase